MNHRLLLAEALKEKQSRNPLFSLRAMAKQLSLSSAHLSQLLSGKRPLTLRVAMKIADKLEMSEADRNRLLAAATPERRPAKLNLKMDFVSLKPPEFEPISEWYYFAILSMGKLKGNRASAKWISRQLGLSFSEAREAYEKLRSLGYIEEKDGKFRQSTKPLHSTRDISSQAIRKHHKQNLELAKDRIETVPVELRDFTSMTMAIHRKEIAQAKKMIHEFRLKLHKTLDTEKADDVYTLAIQFFPLTENKKEIPK